MKSSTQNVLLILATQLIFLSCSHLFYQPNSYVYSRPEQFGLQAKDHYIEVDKGTKIHVREFAPQGVEKGIVVFLHGNAENLSSHIVQAHWLPKNGYRLYMPDYRGYGESTGRANQEGVLNDAQKAMALALAQKQQNPNLKLIIWGQSLGGAIALPMLAIEKQLKLVDLLILDSTFDDYKKIAFQKLTEVPLLLPFSPLAYVLISNHYAPKYFYKPLLSTRLLVLHSQNDQIVPFSFGKTIYERYLGPKEFWTFSGFNHIGMNFEVENQKRVLDYLKNLP